MTIPARSQRQKWSVARHSTHINWQLSAKLIGIRVSSKHSDTSKIRCGLQHGHTDLTRQNNWHWSHFGMPRLFRKKICFLAIFLGCSALAACALTPPPLIGLIEIIARPAEKALMLGINAYDNGQYTEAEKQLNTALQGQLSSAKDKSAAHKYLAFIQCASQRLAQCEAAFKAAKNADPQFMLNRSEQGHPVWGPIYRKAGML
jgi:tetratricopeptide (TPR) repeat protein